MSERFYIQNNEILDSGFFLGSKQAVVDILNNQAEQIRSLEEQLKNVEKFKEWHGYSDWDTKELLNDLQSRAFQAEDDTRVVEDLLTHFGLYDENEIMDKVKSLEKRLAELEGK